MREYEVMVIFDPDTEERTVQPTLEKHLTVITKGGGTVDNLDIWGRRRLAYEIRKKSEGIYAVITLTAEPATVKELDRQFTERKITPAILASIAAQIGERQGELRAVHLKYHLTTAELLTPDQKRRYSELRGYH